MPALTREGLMPELLAAEAFLAPFKSSAVRFCFCCCRSPGSTAVSRCCSCCSSVCRVVEMHVRAGHVRAEQPSPAMEQTAARAAQRSRPPHAFYAPTCVNVRSSSRSASMAGSYQGCSAGCNCSAGSPSCSDILACIVKTSFSALPHSIATLVATRKLADERDSS